jgi:hypothetical protein
MILMLAGNDVTDGPGEVSMATQNRVMMAGLIRCPTYRQQGAVLVIGMILLLVLTVIGVTMMTSTTQDEKLSGNTKRGSDAFMAAEAGLSAIKKDLYTDYDGENSDSPPKWFYYRCQDDGDGNYVLVDPEGELVALGDELIRLDNFGGLGSFYTVTLDEEEGDACQPVMQYDLASNGYINTEKLRSLKLISTGAQAESTALREIHFNIGGDNGENTGESSWPAVFVNDNPAAPQCNFDFGNSNSYLYSGMGGPALSTNSQDCAEAIRNSHNYNPDQVNGGVVANNPDAEFTSPSRLPDSERGGLREFYKALLNSDRTQNVYPGTPHHVHGIAPVNFNDPKYSSVNFGATGTVSDADDFDELQTVIVHGDAELPGGLTGAGVLVITGDAVFAGTPDWDGIIVVLGGTVEMGGAGTGGFNGTLIISNIDFNGFDYCNFDGECQSTEDSEHYAPSPRTDTPWEFDASNPEIDWDVGGGGTANYSYGCEVLMKVGNYLLADEGDNGADIDEADSFPAPSSCPSDDGDGGGEDDNSEYGPLYIYNWLEQVNN